MPTKALDGVKSDTSKRTASESGRDALRMLHRACAPARIRRLQAALLLASTSGLALGNASASELVTAASRGDLEQAFALLAEGTPVDEASPDGTRALHWAVYNGQVELARRLVGAGADVTVANEYGATPMSEAAVRGDVEILALLLDAGADVDSPNVEGQSALMVIARRTWTRRRCCSIAARTSTPRNVGKARPR